MIRRILVGLGGHETENAGYTESATRMAIDLARRNDAAVTGVTVVNVAQLQAVGPTPIGAGHAAAELRDYRVGDARDRIDAAIARFTDLCRDAGVEPRILREERGAPFDYLISQARYHDLTLLGLRGLFEYGSIGEAQYDSVASLVRLIEGGVRPLIATGPEPHTIERVLIAYSGSNESAKTMRRYAQLNLWPEAKVRIVAFGPDHERRQRHLLHASNYFDDHGIEVERDYQPSDPKQGVLKVAQEWNADLVVMGNSARTLLSRRVLGDTMLATLGESDRALFLSQ